MDKQMTEEMNKKKKWMRFCFFGPECGRHKAGRQFVVVVVGRSELCNESGLLKAVSFEWCMWLTPSSPLQKITAVLRTFGRYYNDTHFSCKVIVVTREFNSDTSFEHTGCSIDCWEILKSWFNPIRLGALLAWLSVLYGTFRLKTWLFWIPI